MKKRYNNLIWWICGGGLILTILTLPIYFIAKAIGQNDDEKTFFVALLMCFCCVLAYATIMVVKSVRYFKTEKQEEQEKLAKVQEKLTTDFKKVRINNSSYINKELFECQAKKNTDGKIVCKLQLDYETKFDSYEKFLQFFSLDENS